MLLYVVFIVRNMLLVIAIAFLVYILSNKSKCPTAHYAVTNMTEGSPCVSNNVTGTCVKMYSCSILIVDLMHPWREKQYPDICSFDGNIPIVCCTSCNYSTVENISDAVYAPSGLVYWKSGKKHWDKCLEYSKYAESRCWLQGGAEKEWDDDLKYRCEADEFWLPTSHRYLKCHYLKFWEFTASGGMDAKREEYTHMALLGFGPTIDQAQWLCGGSLISEKFILTAAHCTSEPILGRVAYAALGILKRSDSKELWQKYNIKRIVSHPKYKSPLKYHDIALLETHNVVTFNKAVFPACLLSVPKNDYGLSHATAIGWGALGRNMPTMADTLQVITIKMLRDGDCKKQYPPHRLFWRGYDNSTQMCYGDKNRSIDTCQGDSGGPLQIGVEELCMYFLIGVTSYGRACGYPGKAGIYTRVRHYIPWIESVVWPEA